MAQKGSNRKRQAPVYSADTMALRMLAGLALAALGVVMFLAVDLRMRSNIFDGLRNVCFGLCGALALVLPVLPVWAGVLVIWSTQRKAPVMPWLYASLGFLSLCAFLVLITRTSTQDYLSYLRSSYLSASPASVWGESIGAGYEDGLRHQWSGGAVGVVFAWPLWKFLGSFLGAVITFLLTAFCLLLAVNLTPSRIRDLVTGRAGQIREQQQNQRMMNDEQQMAWQQEQARQRMLREQEQQRILEQQAQQQAAWQQAQQMQQQQQPAGYPPAQQTSASSIMAWQDQTTAQRLASTETGSAHESRIFGRKGNAARNEDSGKTDRPKKSHIFSRKEAYDGLSEPAEKTAAAALQAASRRRTATGMEIEKPVTSWSSGSRDAYRRPADEQPARETATERPAVPEDPPEDFEPETEVPAEIPTVQPARQTAFGQRRTETAAAVKKTPAPETPAAQPADRRAGSWSSQVQAALDAQQAQPAEEKPAKTTVCPEPKQEQINIPVVQQEIGKAAYQPNLKVPPRHQDEEEEDTFWTPRPYVYPPITDLKPAMQSTENTAAEDEMRSRRLEETLGSFKVQARVVNVTHGPAISRFELELAAGTKVNKVAELEKDIAYGMEATSVRIEAPIPGKSLVGVEVPNRKVATVTLREVLESEKMQNAKSLLTVALGKDIAGTPIVCDLAKMPHMLIAGQTGSGKSVCINAIINSLLYRAGPDEVKLILVDPKVVELQCYNGIPHLLIPVVNDPHKAAAALAWAVAEMMERYDKFAERKVRNLDGYNAVLQPGEKPMSRIVIIIDELADLMMVCKKDVEEYICRLTQLARAAGIHLIVATQRPSVDVITGLIKANIPSRIAFKTASYVDSRTILDRNGAEQLLGWGDMLYLPTGSFAPTRVQGCFLSDEEVNKIVDHVRRANPATYDPDILEKLEQLAGGSAADMSGADMAAGTGELGGGDGGLFEQAVEFAISDGQISTSTLQRRLKIGYARAGRLTDEMEERGIIAAKDGSKPRKCLITREEWEAMKQEV